MHRRYRSHKKRAFHSSLALLLAVPFVTACVGVEGTENFNRYASVTFRTVSGFENVVSPAVVFFSSGATGLPSSTIRSNQCANAIISQDLILPGNLKGGESLSLQVGGNDFTLRESTLVPGIYVYGSTGSVPYAEGDSAKLQIPGQTGGFPGGSIAGLLAEPVRLGPLPPVVAGENLPVTWETNGDNNSAIIFSLRYATEAGAEVANRQVHCVVEDNGSFTLPGAAITEWQTANAALRHIVVTRWRTRAVEIDERSFIHLSSTWDTTVVSFD